MKDKRLREIKRVWEREREREDVMVIFAKRLKNEKKIFKRYIYILNLLIYPVNERERKDIMVIFAKRMRENIF